MGSVTVSVGHTVDFAIAYLDQNGNPMLTTPTPDSPPVWSDTTAATGTLTPAANGLTASELANAVGADSVSASVIVGGQTFTSSIDVDVEAEPQVLTSIAIVATAH
jgi:hypothetical protein